MLVGESVRAASVAAAWKLGLRYFRSPEKLYRHDSERGVAFDVPGLTLVVDSISDLSVPDGYVYPDLVTQYTDRLLGDLRDESLIHARMWRWRASDGGLINQLDQVAELLLENPESRAAAFSLWRPEEDSRSAFPVSPVAGCFRVIGGALHLLLVARSVDYWVGAVPEMISFGQVQRAVADRLSRATGMLTYHMWSAHIYELDCLVHLARRDDRA